MLLGIKITLIVGIVALMLYGGVYVYRFLNNKIISANSGFELLFYGLLLFIVLGVIYMGGLFLIAFLYNYLVS